MAENKGTRNKRNRTADELADEIVKMLIDAGLDYDDCLNVLRLAREKLEYRRIHDK